MQKAITWLGHNSWLFEAGETRIAVDPFFKTAQTPAAAHQLRADYVLVSHGHDDHCADAVELATRSGSTLVAMHEASLWFARHGVKKVEGMGIGGSIPFAWLDGGIKKEGRFFMVPALHSSTMPDGTTGGNPCGFVVSIPKTAARLPISPNDEVRPLAEALADAFSVYFACDTAFFPAMTWIGSLGIDVAVIPIGDRYTMGPNASLDAIRALRAPLVIPCHYNTWPPIAQNVDRWSDGVKKYCEGTRPMPLKVGQRETL